MNAITIYISAFGPNDYQAEFKTKYESENHSIETLADGSIEIKTDRHTITIKEKPGEFPLPGASA